MTFLSLLEVDGEPKRNLDRFSWLKWSESATYKLQLVTTEIWLDLDELILTEKLVFGGSPVAKVHFYNFNCYYF